MKVSSIDIGTNSVLLLVADKQDGRLKVLEEKQEIPRLGKNVDQEKKLHPESMDRVLAVLEKYRTWLAEYHPEVVAEPVVTATSAVRDASNRQEFLSKIADQTGWKVQLLSGEKEAETTYRGAVSVLAEAEGSKTIVLDIGGGSTEIAIGNSYSLEKGISFDMGSVRFSERFFKNGIPDKININEARAAARSFLKDLKKPEPGYRAVGVAGTVTSIAGIEIGLKNYDSNRINDFKLQKTSIEKFISEFSAITGAEIEKKYPVFLKGRGDVILAGIIILDEFLKWSENKEIVVSTGGIRHGILMEINS